MLSMCGIRFAKNAKALWKYFFLNTRKQAYTSLCQKCQTFLRHVFPKDIKLLLTYVFRLNVKLFRCRPLGLLGSLIDEEHRASKRSYLSYSQIRVV
jgi:hypothetical protein